MHGPTDQTPLTKKNTVDQTMDGPGVWLKVSQMFRPRSSTAPSYCKCNATEHYAQMQPRKDFRQAGRDRQQ